jgi:hypothetical protein
LHFNPQPLHESAAIAQLLREIRRASYDMAFTISDLTLHASLRIRDDEALYNAIIGDRLLKELGADVSGGESNAELKRDLIKHMNRMIEHSSYTLQHEIKSLSEKVKNQMCMILELDLKVRDQQKTIAELRRAR